jgi:NAD-dependent deacetylase
MASRSADVSTAAAELAALIAEADSVVALTGAGVSVPSGIPDFRTPGTGIWENVNPMEVATIEAFRSDPARFWSFYRPRFEALGDKEPNAAHKALVELEGWGIDAVVTQNVDRLHRKAGSARVIEVHGSIQTSSCTSCPGTWQLEEVETLFDDDGIATCPACMGRVKPDVVLFGEMLPEQAMQQAADLAQRADVMLCIGSSLEVHPVAGLPEITLASGGKLAIVTQGPTPYDDAAHARMSGDVVEDLEAVLAALRA